MLLAIFIFLIIILILAMNIHVCIKSKDDNILIYAYLGRIGYRIPRLQIDLSKKIDMKKGRNLALLFASHSVVDHVYIAKYSNLKNEFTCALFLIISNQIRGILHSGFRLVHDEKIIIIHDENYENIDYYFEAHISIINMICALIKGKVYGTN